MWNISKKINCWLGTFHLLVWKTESPSMLTPCSKHVSYSCFRPTVKEHSMAAKARSGGHSPLVLSIVGCSAGISTFVTANPMF